MAGTTLAHSSMYERIAYQNGANLKRSIRRMCIVAIQSRDTTFYLHKRHIVPRHKETSSTVQYNNHRTVLHIHLAITAILQALEAYFQFLVRLLHCFAPSLAFPYMVVPPKRL